MRDALLYGWQGHVVAIGALQVIFIADHRLVGLVLEGDIDTLCDILGRKTALDTGASLGHIAYGVGWLCQHNESAELALNLAHTHGPALIDPIGQARLQGIALRDFTTADLIKQLLLLKDTIALLGIVGHIVDWEDVHIDAYLVALGFRFDHARALVDDLGKGIVIMGFRCGIDGAIDAIVVVIGLEELLVVLARHIDVDVVVPGNIALVTHGTNERATGKEISQAMRLAKLMHMVKNAHLNLAQLVYIFYLSHRLRATKQPFLEYRTDAQDV